MKSSLLAQLMERGVNSVRMRVQLHSNSTIKEPLGYLTTNSLPKRKALDPTQ